MKIVCTTPRLFLREAAEPDADFFVALLNSPGWLEYIGDRQIRTPEEATEYLRKRVFPAYENPGFGAYCIQLHDSGATVGVCGLYKRETLPFYDLGYALLPEFEGNGYIHEAAAAVLKDAEKRLQLPVLLAITSKGNLRSVRVLEKLGFRLEGDFRFPDDDELLNRFRIDLS